MKTIIKAAMLSLSIRCGWKSAIIFLLNRGAKLSEKSAALGKCLDLFREQSEDFLKAYLKGNEAELVLREAAARKDVELFAAVFTAGTDPNQMVGGITLLECAVYCNWGVPFIQEILRAGAHRPKRQADAPSLAGEVAVSDSFEDDEKLNLVPQLLSDADDGPEIISMLEQCDHEQLARDLTRAGLKNSGGEGNAHPS